MTANLRAIQPALMRLLAITPASLGRSPINFKHAAGFAIADAVIVIAAIRCLHLWMRMFNLPMDDLGGLLYGHYLDRMLVASEFWLLVGLIFAAVTFWLSGLHRLLVLRLFHFATLTLGGSVFVFRWIAPTLFRLL